MAVGLSPAPGVMNARSGSGSSWGSSGGRGMLQPKPPSMKIGANLQKWMPGPHSVIPGPGQTPGTSGTQAPKPAAPAAAAQPSPYDSTYYIDLARATAKANDAIAGYQGNIANAGTALNGPTGTLAQLQYNQNQAVIKAQSAENARGGFAQGALGDSIGQLNHAYQTTASNDVLKYQQDSANWQNAISAARQGLSIETIALGLASAGRQSKVNVASDGTLAPPAPGSSPLAAAAGVTPGKPAGPAAGKPAAGKSKSIIGRALAGHPAWRIPPGPEGLGPVRSVG